jgi:hypothetical protein
LIPRAAPRAVGGRMDEAGISERIRVLKARLEELERNRPAHGLKPAHIVEIEEIEDKIDELEDMLAGLPDEGSSAPGQH